jgi:polygalacturonase
MGSTVRDRIRTGEILYRAPGPTIKCGRRARRRCVSEPMVAKTRLLLLAMYLCCTAQSGPGWEQQQRRRRPRRQWKVFNVREFGASGSGGRSDTAAVRSAATALAKNGGGQLLFPRGGTYLTGAFNLSSHTEVLIEPSATVLGSSRGEDWPLLDAAAVWPWFGHGSDCDPGTEACRLMHQALLFAWNAQNVTIRGGGAVDCNSSLHGWWGCAQNLSAPPCSGHARPHCVMMANSTDVEVSALTVRNSPDWTLHFAGVRRLRVRRVNVSNPPHAPNADGIDVDGCSDVVVEDCR